MPSCVECPDPGSPGRATRLFLVRHPKVRVPPGTCYGRREVPLASGWQATVDALRQELPPRLTVVSSPAQRCLGPAEYLAGEGETVSVDTRWQELDFGEWEGRLFDDLPRTGLDRWATAPWDFLPPGGENVRDLVCRVHAALVGLLARPAGDCLIVAHAGPIRAASGILRGLPEADWLSLPCAWSQLSSYLITDTTRKRILQHRTLQTEERT